MGNPEPQRTTIAGGLSNRDWWPEMLNLDILHQNSPKGNPLGEDFNYAEEFKKLDLSAVRQDLAELMTDSQDWWPADYGHYGPFFIRMAWHSAGTYRLSDGRGGAGYGTQRFAPLNSWPDNGNLDKARRLLWPIKQKYKQKISWADLMILCGDMALETMGFKTFGFSGGREDRWEPQDDIFWGPESEWLGSKRYSGDRDLDKSLGAVQMGLIYVNPEGPDGNPDPAAAAHDIRETFKRMAMNDEETVALIAGGHTFGKAHGAHDPDGIYAADGSKNVGPEPEGAPLEEQGFGWIGKQGKGHSEDTVTSGLEGAWSTKPTEWSNDYFDHLFNYEWELTKSPAGAQQWTPKGEAGAGTVPDAHIEGKTHAPIMFTTDLALRIDPEYEKISRRYHENPSEFAEAFSKAWYKLVSRDLGPIDCCLGPDVPPVQLFQDPVPPVEHELIGEGDIESLKAILLSCGLTRSQLISTAWASASTYRGSDKRGGANGARIRLAPQKDWPVNKPDELAQVLATLEKVQSEFDKPVSLADLIVLGGCAALEAAGNGIKVPFTPGRTDASDEMTDHESFEYLEPKQDGFRNYLGTDLDRPGPETLLDRAQLLGLSAPEMTALLGGMRMLETNVGHPSLGVFTDKPGTLSNDFFTNLLDMSTKWNVSDKCEHFYEGVDRQSGELKWMGTSFDLVIGSNSQLRAIAEVYAADEAKFLTDFVAVWTKIMEADRFDLK